MTRRLLGALGLVLAACLVMPAGVADAQRRRRREPAAPARPADPMQAAEQAFAAVDFDHTLEYAAEALQAGQHPRERVVRIYRLLGMSAGALGDAEGARDFFLRMLAIDSSAELDDSVSPRQRAPYLEARGLVAARSESMAIAVELVRAQASLRIEITDPFQLVRTLRVHGRAFGAPAFETVETPAQGTAMALVEAAGTADRVEYWVEMLDPFGNQLASFGSEFDPRVVGRAPVAELRTGSPDGRDSMLRDERPRSLTEEPLFWVALVGGAALVGAGVGVGFAVESASHIPVQTSVSFGLP